VQPELEALFFGDARRDFFVGEVSSSEFSHVIHDEEEGRPWR
jgi:hypothetical protein